MRSALLHSRPPRLRRQRHHRRIIALGALAPDGVQRDMLVFDGRDADEAWNGIWRVRTARIEGGWTMEMFIPWKTLRYAGGEGWRVNFIREARAIQETSLGGMVATRHEGVPAAPVPLCRPWRQHLARRGTRALPGPAANSSSRGRGCGNRSVVRTRPPKRSEKMKC